MVHTSIKSLFIPHVFPNYDEEAIRDSFMNICVVDHIDMVNKLDKTGKQYNAVYLHVSSWFDWNDECRKFLTDIEKNGKTNFYYSERFYWIVLPNTAQKHVSGDRKIRIELGDLKKDKANVCRTPKQVISRTPRAPLKVMPIGPIAPTLDSMYNNPIIDSLKPIKLNVLFDACKKKENDEIMAIMMAELTQAQIDDINNAMDEIDLLM